MKELSLFYSYQSDRPRDLCRDFIEKALRAAILSVPKELDSWIQVESDLSERAPGSPDVFEAIFRKLSVSDIVVADLTHVAKTEPHGGREPRSCANPNVVLELGYAFHAITANRIILIENEHYRGIADGLSDLSARKHPLRYKLSPHSTEDDRETTLDELSKKLSDELIKVVKLGKFTQPDLNNQYSKWWIDRKQRREDNQEVSFEGFPYRVKRGVFSPDPRLTNSASMMARLMPKVEGKRVLDLGTGCGVLAILAAKRGAKEVVAVDNDSDALANAQENADRYEVRDKITFVEGNLFEGTDGEFDVILANLPIDPRPPAWRVSTSDVNKVAREFLEQVRSKLSPKGAALLTWASFGDLKRLEDDLEELEISFREPTIEETFGVTWYLYEIRKNRLAK